MGRHELLLFADRVEEAQSVRAEADQPQGHERHEAQAGCGNHLPPFVRSRWCEHEEGQRQAGGDLDRDARHQRDGCRSKAGVGPRCERQRAREQQQDQRVIVRAAHGQHEQNRVQADERGGPPARLT